MRRLILVAACLLFVPAVAQAQNDTPNSKAQGYAFFAVGGGQGANSELAGGGLDIFLHKGLAFEVEPAWARLGFYHDKEILVSTDISYHFRRRAGRGQATPFVALGYTAFVPTFGGLYDSGSNFGAGVNLWVRRKVALRLEVRHYINARTSGIGVPHVTAFRVGVTFR